MLKRGFFPSRNKKSRPLCSSCGLYLLCQSPKMRVTGKGKKGILIVAEAPGGVEDEENTQLVGKAGQFFRKKLKLLGYDLDEDCRKTNAVCCRPPGNRTPTDKEIGACRVKVFTEIEKSKPKLIILLGGTALQSFLGHRWKGKLGGITKWRGLIIPDREVNAWVCPTYHPSYVQRHTTEDVAELIFEQDLKQALSLIKNSEIIPLYRDERECVRITTDPKQIDRFLHWLLVKAPLNIAIDYETTGLKPYVSKGHRIVACAIAYSKNRVTAFPLKDENKKMLCKVLKHPKIHKYAANIKFEHAWSKACLECDVVGWKWDTMQAAHILDNRPKITSLDFQVYANFGVTDYSSHIKPYFRLVDPKDINGLNIIDECPLEDLLPYVALDALYEFRLANKQIREMKERT